MPHEKPWSALVQAMAWCIFTTKPLPELMFIISKTLISLHKVYRCKFYEITTGKLYLKWYVIFVDLSEPIKATICIYSIVMFQMVIFIIYTVYVWCLGLRKCQYSLPIYFVVFLDSVMNKHLNNNIYRICFSFCLIFSETPLFQNVTNLYKQFTSRNLLLENLLYIWHISAILKWMGVGMSECIQANSKNWYCIDNGQYCIHTVSSLVPIHTQYCSVLYMYWVVMDCTFFVSDLHCILDDDTKMVLLSTVFLPLVSNSTVFVSAFWCIPKTCTNTVRSSIVFIPVIRYLLLVYGTGMVSERCTKRYRSVPFQYRVPGIRYRNSTSF